MRWLTLVVVAAVTAMVLLWIFQRRLIYFPSQSVPDPSIVLPGADVITFPTEDGLELTAWFVPPIRAANGGTVVVFNGNAGNRAHRAPLAEELAGRGYAVLLFDYRGYGGNPGRPSESGLAADARAALGYLRARPDVAPHRVAYFGESLGAAVALGLAAEHPPAALVLRSPFTSLADVGSAHYPFLPVSLLLWDRYPNLDRIRSIDVPVMIIAGSDDGIVPFDQSRELYDAASEPKRLLVIEGADHNDFELVAGREVIDGVTAFLDEMLPGD